MKILVVCGHGLGTSLMMEMSIKTILKELSVTADVDHRDLASAGTETAEIFVATRDIAEQLQAMGVNGRLVALDNMVDKAAMKEKISAALRELGAL
ncbi:PTS sugar transporter subunit IIB [Serratia microhaemolytica]|uniref:PTS sugar transporter subunit IIB n=1 Tax=Serratia microhaemolytica TaxID=2675110 RepID=UPI000FDD26ED|nr:PTS sugar transporter subunit IIB [Serratia microhaemolytica]